MSAAISPPEWDLLLSAAQKNDVNRIRTLIQQQGVPPTHANAVGQTALHIAALWGHVEAAQALIEAGANCHARNKLTGATPLHMVAQSSPQKATTERRLAMIDLLVQAGADPSAADQNGAIPADYLRFREEDLVSPELVAKLTPKAPALFQAIQDCDVAAVQNALTNKSSNVNIAYRSQTPIQYAVQEFLNLIEQQQQQSEDPPSNELLAKAQSLVDILDALIQAGSDALIPHGEDSPLYLLLNELSNQWKRAATSHAGDENQLSSLLQKAVLVLIPQKQLPPTVAADWQLLQRAARRNEVTFLQFLIEQLHIDPNIKARQGMTALQFAARSGNVEALRYLLTLPNIDVTLKDDRGQSAVDAARINEKYEAIQLLEEFERNAET